VKVDAAASESGTEEQVSKLEAMTSAQYDCYAVAPITATNLLQPLVPIAQEKGAIVNLDAPIGTKEAEQAGVAPATFIASNHGQAGVLGAEHMAEVLGDKAQGAEIVLVGGIAGDATSNARTKGFQDTAAQSGMKIAQTGNADWDRDKALTLAGDILRARPNVSGFFAANDTMALGIQQAVQNAGKEDQVTVIGVDGAEQALQSIERGGMAATVAQYPYAVGALGVEACVAQVQGKDLPKTIESPLAVVTKENVSKALASYPKPFETVENPIAELIER
jgi:ABC-type sugar transport system substrate-binding protein